MKKLKKVFTSFLIFLVTLLGVPQLSFAAYSHGLLFGQKLYQTPLDNVSTFTTAATDDNHATYAQLNNQIFYWYKFSQPMTITSYFIDSSQNIDLILLDANKNQIYRGSMTTHNATASLPQNYSNVTYIEIFDNTGSVVSFYDVDLYGGTSISPPDAPASLTAQFNDGNVSLSWSSVSGATSYNLYRNGSAYKTGLTSTSYTDTAVTNGTTYSYYVTASNTAGESADSNTVTGKPMPPIPPVPSNIGATVTSNTVKVTWSLESGADSYNVYQDGVKINSSPITTSSYLVSGLADGSYSFTVTAVNMSGESGQSTPVSAYVDTTPPSIPSGLNGTGQTNSVLLKWTNPPEPDLNGVYVYVNGTKTTIPITANSYLVPNLKAGQTYQFAVSSVDNTGNESALSAAILVKVPETTLQPPSNISIGGNGQMTWTSPSTNPAGTAYTIYQNGQPVGTTSGNTYTVPSYNPNSTYSVSAGYNGTTTNPVTTGGAIQADSSKWGFSAVDVLSNTMHIIGSVAGFLLLSLVIIFSDDIRRLIRGIYERYKGRVKL